MRSFNFNIVALLFVVITCTVAVAVNYGVDGQCLIGAEDGDFNGDCAVNLADLNMFANNWLGYQEVGPDVLAKWSLDSDVMDSSGNDHHGTMIGSPTFVTDPQRGKVLSLNGSSYVDFSMNVPETDYAVSFWFKTNSNVDCGLFEAVNGNGSAYDRSIYFYDSDLGAYLWPGEAKHIRAYDIDYADNQWHHVVHTFGAATGGQRLYVDNNLVAADTTISTNFDWGTIIRFGHSNLLPSNFFIGLIDEVCIYSTTFPYNEDMNLDMRIDYEDYGVFGKLYSGKGVRDSLSLLPVGSITPQGWIYKHIAEDSQNGWVSKVEQMSLDSDWWPAGLHNYGNSHFYQPYIDRHGSHAAGEYQSHWLDNHCRMGWVAGIESSRNLAHQAVNAIIANIPESDYLGVAESGDEFNNVSSQISEYELWSYGEHIHALLLYYRYTQDPRALNVCVDAANAFCANIGPYNEDQNQPYGHWWGSPIYSFAKLYKHTGNSRYLRVAEYLLDEYLKKYNWNIVSLRSNKWITGHTAGVIIGVKGVLELYRVTSKPQYLQLLEVIDEKVESQHLLVNGSPSGHGEHLCGTGPYIHMELCDPFWWSWHWCEMLRLTEDIHYADMAEKAFFNALPGARSKDGGASAYFTCQNQLTTTKNILNTAMKYSVRQFWDCCNSNAPRMMPIMAENMILFSDSGEVSVAYYGPTTATFDIGGSEAVITQETNYPFEETVRIRVALSSDTNFALKLRIPSWCESASIKVNDSVVSGDYSAGSWACVERIWQDGDCLELMLPMQIKVVKKHVSTDVRFWLTDAEKEGNWADAVVVERGPLLYSLPVAAAVHTPLTTLGVHRGAFEEIAAASGDWNYALVLDQADPASSFTVVAQSKPADSNAWEGSPIALEVDAKRVLGWNCTSGDLIGQEDSPRLADRKWVAPDLPQVGFSASPTIERLRLVPYGFTTLRMTYLPWVDAQN